MNFKNLPELLDFFKDEDVCRLYLEKMRWAGAPICPYCGHSGTMYRIENGKRMKCGNKDCHKKFSVTVGTVFENTKIKLRLWFGALYLVTAHKKGISSLQLSRDLAVTQKTAWFMLHRIREMLKTDAPEMLHNTVEVDESYIGGKDKNKHKNKRSKVAEITDPLRRGTGDNKGKAPVVGMVERGGKVYAKKVWTAKQENVLPIIGGKIHENATIITDSWPAYQKLGEKYEHFVVDHSSGEYVRGRLHTNTIEGFWSLLKRGIVGIYHSVSYKHLNKYCGEFAFRYNSRQLSDPQRFDYALPMAEGRRITYKELTHRFYFND